MAHRQQTAVKPFCIGVAGGTGSGKTTVVQNIMRLLRDDPVICLTHDDYYRDQTHKTMAQRRATNYDHPDSLETDLLISHLQALLAGQSIQRPVYDFVHHNRSAQTVRVAPAPVILVEGILLFESAPLRALMDLKIFVDTDADIRLARRIKRDIADRGRTLEFSLNQYLQYSRPMHLQFVEPSKRYADIIVPEGGENEKALQLLLARIREFVSVA